MVGEAGRPEVAALSAMQHAWMLRVVAAGGGSFGNANCGARYALDSSEASTHQIGDVYRVELP